MTEFRDLELGDRDLFQKYLGEYSFNTYEYSFLTLYIWRKMCDVKINIIDGTLIIKKSGKNTGSYFMQPLGCKKEDLGTITLKLNEIRKSDASFKSLFRDVEFPFLSQLLDEFDYKVCFCDDIDNFDYIYDVEDLITLSGNKFHSKKNQYNQFIKKYRYELRDISDKAVARECVDFATIWYERRKDDDAEQLKFELESIREILACPEYLNIKGMAVYVGGRVAGFTIGEKVNDNMAVIHVEKGDFKYSGIYSFINKTFAEKYLRDVKLINRQEDLGIEGLRKAKMAYNPIRLEKKFIVDLT